MGVQLNIKDERTVTIARDLARQLGKTVTETIRDALEDKVRARDVERGTRVVRMLALADEIYAELPDAVKAMTSKELMDSIYDDNEPDGFAR
ncbi:type II toxin-antitoxin system VapB family antitoxin [uncultured Sphingomonas sp.]|uniref:type II toxin-antitoxin system VapB family antitoxin n=1 Tax=uncultured Sphingomonas sp. TaxID=158754 RepID=UPI0035CB51F6